MHVTNITTFTAKFQSKAKLAYALKYDLSNPCTILDQNQGERFACGTPVEFWIPNNEANREILHNKLARINQLPHNVRHSDITYFHARVRETAGNAAVAVHLDNVPVGYLFVVKSDDAQQLVREQSRVVRQLLNQVYSNK